MPIEVDRDTEEALAGAVGFTGRLLLSVTAGGALGMLVAACVAAAVVVLDNGLKKGYWGFYGMYDGFLPFYLGLAGLLVGPVACGLAGPLAASRAQAWGLGAAIGASGPVIYALLMIGRAVGPLEVLEGVLLMGLPGAAAGAAAGWLGSYVWGGDGPARGRV